VTGTSVLVAMVTERNNKGQSSSKNLDPKQVQNKRVRSPNKCFPSDDKKQCSMPNLKQKNSCNLLTNVIIPQQYNNPVSIPTNDYFPIFNIMLLFFLHSQT